MRFNNHLWYKQLKFSFFLFLLVISHLSLVICNSSFALTPNDTLYPQQWGLAAISAEAAWNVTTGSSSIAIAVINNGIDPNMDTSYTTYNWPPGSVRGHPDINPVGPTNLDLAGSKTWININDPVDNSDNDLNGYTDDYHGANLLETLDDSTKKAQIMYHWEPYDDSFHFYYSYGFGYGTRYSGIIGGITDNSKGIAGVAWNCKIMQVRVLDGLGSPTSIDTGIRYAADNGAKVILLPVRFPASSASVSDKWDNLDWGPINTAIQYAHNKGCVLIAPIGNDGTTAVNPIATFEGVIGVGSVGETDTGIHPVSSFSNRNQFVDVVAPGENILSTYLCNARDGATVYSTGSYEPFSDTGAAAAFVAGYAGLIFSANPSWTNARVEKQIINTALPINENTNLSDITIPRGSQRNNKYGYGLIDLSAGLDVTAPPTPTVNPLVTPTNLSPFTLTGTMSAYPLDTRRILINGSETGITYLTSTTWSASGTLAKGINKLQVTAQDAASNESSPATVEVELKDMPFNDISGNNIITFPIDSTSTRPIATVEVYSGPTLDPANPAAATKISSIMNISSSANILTGKTVMIKLKITGTTVNPSPYYWDDSAKLWKNNGITVTAKDAASVTFTSTRSNGIFGIFDVSGNLGDILIYPVPYKIGTTDPNGVVFSGLKGDETIRIYTLSGELVTSSVGDYQGTQTWTWQAKNSSDYLVAQDIYYFLITNGAGQKKSGKIAVIN